MATFASLPVDVLVLILRQSHDLESLLSSRASCRVLHDAFNHYPTSLIKSFVTREIDGAVLPEAILAVKAAQIRRTRPLSSELPAAVSQLLSDSRDSKAFLDHRWTIADGIAAIKLGSAVNFIAKRAELVYLSRLKAYEWGAYWEASDGELARFKRALYRFEIYCSLFPPPEGIPDSDFEAARFGFLMRFSPWENEQLACLHELLSVAVAKAFNNPNPTRQDYNELMSEPPTDDTLRREVLISRGVERINDVLHAKYWKEHCKLVDFDYKKLSIHTSFLRRAFKEFKLALLRDPSLVTGKKSKKLDAGFYKDPNPGPEKYWRWSHDIWKNDEARLRMVEEGQYRSMREVGLVFWDKERLDMTGLWSRTWHENHLESDYLDESDF